ncbi:MAG: YbbR-like domain-containing protein [Ignavibacteriales bacterium]|nr:YbbR-like domain-containing protein [Ignavibacteriales bacterium]MBK7980027.1 YbbR-like domain-containing protein [Ignavibacteriota bacterium]
MKKKIITILFILTFSILLWVFVSFSGEFSITLNLPPKVLDVPENLAVSHISAKEIILSLKGQGWQLAQHTLGRDPKFLIQSPQEIGETVIPTKNMLNANTWISSTLQLAELSPEKITLKLEKKITKKVEILPVLVLSFKPGYDLVSQAKILPDSVTISGPESIVNEYSIINTAGLQLNNLEKETAVKVQLQSPEFVDCNITECKILLNVQKIVDKTFENVLVERKNIPDKYELNLSPENITVVVRGGINLLSKIKNEDINAYVRFQQALNDTTGSIEPTIELPKFTSIVDVKPKRLDYIIKKY